MKSLFGTNGIRWIVDSQNVNFPIKLGLTAGTYFGTGSRIAIGMDTRTSGPMIFNAVVSGLEASGCDVIDVGIVPTPTLQYAVKELNVNGGIVVTASHNPPKFNGLKFIASDGTEFSREQESKVNSIYYEEAFKRADWNKIGKIYHEKHVQAKHRGAVMSMVNVSKSVSTVVDCGNGTAWNYTPDILSKLGCGVLTLNAQPDGRFPGRLPEPTKENIGALMKAVRQHDAEIGIAHDGDADRAAFVDDNGEFITGDNSLALFAIDAVIKNNGGKVVVPVNTSMTVIDAVKANGGEPVITAVGSPLIARKMIEIGAVLGGEGNGGVIFPEHQFCRDGMMTAAKMVEIISKQGSVSNLVAELPKYCLKRYKLKIPASLKDSIIKKVKEDAQGEVLDIDGIKMTYEDYWILVRPSGTEPILRITVETKSDSQCDKLLQDNINWVKEIISDLS